MRSNLLLICISIVTAAPATFVSAGLNVDEMGFATLKLGEEEWKEYPGVPGIK